MKVVAKPPTTKPSKQQEDKVAQPAPLKTTEAPQMGFSFLKLAEGSASGKPKKVNGKADPLAIAKDAVVNAINDQKKYLTIVSEGGTLPKTKETPLKGATNGQTVGGKKTVSTWFWQVGDKHWTTLRYGQLTIELGTDNQWCFSSTEKLHAFYDAVKEGILTGQMDTVIGELQMKRSASLKGRTGTRKAA